MPLTRYNIQRHMRDLVGHLPRPGSRDRSSSTPCQRLVGATTSRAPNPKVAPMPEVLLMSSGWVIIDHPLREVAVGQF